jgi:hypothetical protein
MTAVSEEEKSSPAWKLFNHRFLCSIPSAWARPEQDIKRFGSPATGSKALDREYANLPANVYRSSAEMAELNYKGVPITLHDPKDVLKIRTLIIDHIDAWAKRLNNDYAIIMPKDDDANSLAELMDDITKLESLLLAVDPVAKKQGLPTAHGNLLTKFRQFGFNVERMAGLSKSPEMGVEDKMLETKLTHRALDAVRRWKV